MEYRRNDTERGAQKYWEENLSRVHFVDRKSHMDWLVI